MKASRFCAGVLVLGALAAWGGCSSSSGGDTGRGGFGDGSGAATGSGGTAGEDAGAQGGTGALGVGGSGGMAAGGAPAGGAGGMGGSGTGGSTTGGAGGGVPDADVPDVRFTYEPPDIMNVNQDAACATENAKADPQRAPADIIFVVDTSGSMGFEAGAVQANMNNFSQQIVASGIDAHVILIAGNSICIAPPLGSGACPADSRPPIYVHVPREVGSTNGLQILLQEHANFANVLRPNAIKHVVIVTDDNSDLDAVSFDNQYRALDPTLADYRFHGIYAFSKPDPFAECLLGSTDPCCGGGLLGFDLSAAEGTVYRQLVGMRMGVQGNLCLQDFVPVFNAISTSVVNTAPIDCDFALPQPQTGILDPDQVRLEIVPDSNNPANKFEVQNVGSQAQCGGGGWYYDNPAAPARITLCPESCTQARMGAAPEINVLFGCLIG